MPCHGGSGKKSGMEQRDNTSPNGNKSQMKNRTVHLSLYRVKSRPLTQPTGQAHLWLLFISSLPAPDLAFSQTVSLLPTMSLPPCRSHILTGTSPSPQAECMAPSLCPTYVSVSPSRLSSAGGQEWDFFVLGAPAPGQHLVPTRCPWR